MSNVVSHNLLTILGILVFADPVSEHTKFDAGAARLVCLNLDCPLRKFETKILRHRGSCIPRRAHAMEVGRNGETKNVPKTPH